MFKKKFRIWDKQIKKYIDSRYWVVDSQGNLCNIKSTCVSCYDSSDRYLTEWYIGMNDKNNKEIYDNDIIKKRYMHKRYTQVKKKYKDKLLVVKWRGYRSEAQINNMLELNPQANRSSFQYAPHLSGKLLPKYQNDNFTTVNWSVFSDCEIMGNIHENLELFENQ